MNELVALAKKNPYLTAGGVLLTFAVLSSKGDGGASEQFRSRQQQNLANHQNAKAMLRVALNRQEIGMTCVTDPTTGEYITLVQGMPIVDAVQKRSVGDSLYLKDSTGMTAEVVGGVAQNLAFGGNQIEPCTQTPQETQADDDDIHTEQASQESGEHSGEGSAPNPNGWVGVPQ